MDAKNEKRANKAFRFYFRYPDIAEDECRNPSAWLDHMCVAKVLCGLNHDEVDLLRVVYTEQEKGIDKAVGDYCRLTGKFSAKTCFYIIDKASRAFVEARERI